VHPTFLVVVETGNELQKIHFGFEVNGSRHWWLLMQEEEKRKPAIEMTDDEAMEYLFHPKIVDAVRELTRDDESEEDENKQPCEED
jgi:hypothetical protein